jgi:hypothetical protein
VAILLASVLGCGDGSSLGEGPCHDHCEAQDEAECLFNTVRSCREFCDFQYDNGDSTCHAAMREYYECRMMTVDPCRLDGCNEQGSAYVIACD